MNTLRKRVASAEMRASTANKVLRDDLAPWWKHMRRQRAALLIVGGFASGFALALLPVTWWAKTGQLAFRAAAHVARSAWTPAVLANRFAKKVQR